ncbi:hypothetical protein ACVBIO_10305 [Shewanella sp. 0m-8]
MKKIKVDNQKKKVALFIHKSLCNIDAKTKFFTMELLINLTKIRNDNLRKIINEKTNNLQINLKFPARSTYSTNRNKYLSEYISIYKNHQGNFENLAINEKREIIFDINLGNKANYESINIHYNVDKPNSTPKPHKQNIALIDTLTKIAICKKQVPYKKSISNNIAKPNRNRDFYNEHLKKTLLDVFDATKTLHNIPNSTVDNIKKTFKKYFTIQIKSNLTTNDFYYQTIWLRYDDEINKNIMNGISLILIKPTNLDGLLFVKCDDIADGLLPIDKYDVLNSNKDNSKKHLTLNISEAGELIVTYKNKRLCKKISDSILKKLELDKSETTVTQLAIDKSTPTSYESLIINGKPATRQHIISLINNLERKLSIDNVGPRRLFSDDR